MHSCNYVNPLLAVYMVKFLVHKQKNILHNPAIIRNQKLETKC